MTKSKTGDCYEVHGKAITEGMLGLLCHGTVWHPDVGWHGHSWIELNEDVVIDISNGHHAVLRREVYYEIGKVKDVKKYDVERAIELMLEKGTYGPWDTSSDNTGLESTGLLE